MLNKLLTKISNWYRKNQTISELEKLSDRDLKDIGLYRGEIHYVADQLFRS